MALIVNDRHGRFAAARAGSRRRARRASRRLVAVVAAASVGAAAGCSAEPESVVFPHPPSDTDAPLRAGATPTSTVDPEMAAAIEEILAVYHGSLEASVTANQAGDPHHPDLDRYLAGAARIWVGHYTRNARDDNIYYTGELTAVSATVSDIDLTAQPPTATVEACLDGTDYRPVDRDTGTPVPGAAEGGRFMEKITVQRFAHGRWMVAEYHPLDQPC